VKELLMDKQVKITAYNNVLRLERMLAEAQQCLRNKNMLHMLDLREAIDLVPAIRDRCREGTGRVASQWPQRLFGVDTFEGIQVGMWYDSRIVSLQLSKMAALADDATLIVSPAAVKGKHRMLKKRGISTVVRGDRVQVIAIDGGVLRLASAYDDDDDDDD
jgi:hypothetical protein